MRPPNMQNYRKSEQRCCGTCRYLLSQGIAMNMCAKDKLIDGQFGRVGIFDVCDEHKFVGEE